MVVANTKRLRSQPDIRGRFFLGDILPGAGHEVLAYFYAGIVVYSVLIFQLNPKCIESKELE